MNLRGFYTFGDMYLDGIRDTAQYNRETFNLEQIDVLRGSAAMLFGRSQAGGVINQVARRRCSATAAGSPAASAASTTIREVTGDFSKGARRHHRRASERDEARRGGAGAATRPMAPNRRSPRGAPA